LASFFNFTSGLGKRAAFGCTPPFECVTVKQNLKWMFFKRRQKDHLERLQASLCFAEVEEQFLPRKLQHQNSSIAFDEAGRVAKGVWAGKVVRAKLRLIPINRKKKPLHRLRRSFPMNGEAAGWKRFPACGEAGREAD